MPATANSGSTRFMDSYLEYLPPLFRDDEFMGQFIRIFEDLMKPLENAVNNLELFFDPLLTPEPVLPWLAFWVDLALSPDWPLERRRELVKSAAMLYRWRGTRKGLSEYLRIYTGSVPEISEYIPGMSLGEDNRLGENTRLGSSGTGHHFVVFLDLGSRDEVDINTVRAIIDSQKPAHTSYALQVSRHD
jgi:phage tail-like protein